MVIEAIGPWAAGIDDAERVARCRELRALSHVYLGRVHPLTAALGRALLDWSALEPARAELSAIPALQRRRLLATYAALLLPARGRAVQ
jgi:hypothetical protein